MVMVFYHCNRNPKTPCLKRRGVEKESKWGGDSSLAKLDPKAHSILVLVLVL